MLNVKNRIVQKSLTELGVGDEFDSVIPNYYSHVKPGKSSDPTTVDGWKDKLKKGDTETTPTTDPSREDYKKMVQSTKETKEMAEKHAAFEKKHPGEIARREKAIAKQQDEENMARMNKDEADLATAEKNKALDTDSFQEKDDATARAKDMLATQAREKSDAEAEHRASIGHHAEEFGKKFWGKTKKFAGEVQSGERRLSNAPEHIKRYVKSLDPENTALAAGGALAAGLGALALRKRMKKVQ